MTVVENVDMCSHLDTIPEWMHRRTDGHSPPLSVASECERAMIVCQRAFPLKWWRQLPGRVGTLMVCIATDWVHAVWADGGQQ